MPANEIAPRANLLRTSTARVVEWRPLPNSTWSLIGRCSIEYWTIHQIPIFRDRDGALSAGVPSTPLLDPDGRVRLDPNGKRMYTPLLTFGGGRDRWAAMTSAALAAAGIIGHDDGAP